MVKPFAGFDEYFEQQDAESERNYEQRILKWLLKQLAPTEADALQREAGDEFGFSWFNTSTNIVSMSLATTNTKVRIVDLLKISGVTKTPLWQQYFEARSAHGSPFGLIFPIPGMGQWIMHDRSKLPMTPGYAHIVRPSAKTEEQHLTIQPLPAFVEAMKRVL